MSEQKPTKKQSEVLNYIEEFNNDHDYRPSYREIMEGLNYKSVSTVAAHVNGLVAGGFLEKQENSARSLTVLFPAAEASPSEIKKSHLDWLRKELAKREANAELSKEAKILKAALTLLDQTDN